MKTNWLWYALLILIVLGLLFWAVKVKSTGTSTPTTTPITTSTTTGTTTGTNLPDTGTINTPYPSPTWTDTTGSGKL